MGILKPSARTTDTPGSERIPSGCFSIHKHGGLVASTLPATTPVQLVGEIASAVMDAFASAAKTELPLTDLQVHYSGVDIVARDLRGGIIVFLHPRQLQFNRIQPPPAMSHKNLEEFILHLEAHIECWKQFNHYVNLAREKKFTAEDEAQFLDLKSLITQGSEAISAGETKGGPRKEDIVSLFSSAPSLRYLADMSDTIPSVEGQWHRIYLNLQSLLGQLKVQQNRAGERSGWSLFGKK